MGRRAISARPVVLTDLGKRDMRAQFGALCWRRRQGELEVLLVTSRDSGRWIIPKGWPMDGRTPAEAAAVEAHEEAGVVGVASERCLGVFTYAKRRVAGDLPVIVAVFPVEVTATLATWNERKARSRRWTSLKKAAKLVSDPDLARLLQDPTVSGTLR